MSPDVSKGLSDIRDNPFSTIMIDIIRAFLYICTREKQSNRDMNNWEILPLLLLPFVGTVLGSSAVLFVKESNATSVRNVLLGFASGVMVAASVWSLLIPAMEVSEPMGKWAWVPAVVGFIVGMGFRRLLREWRICRPSGLIKRQRLRAFPLQALSFVLWMRGDV